jgi:hypothetical protein
MVVIIRALSRNAIFLATNVKIYEIGKYEFSLDFNNISFTNQSSLDITSLKREMHCASCNKLKNTSCNHYPHLIFVCNLQDLGMGVPFFLNSEDRPADQSI